MKKEEVQQMLDAQTGQINEVFNMRDSHLEEMFIRNIEETKRYMSILDENSQARMRISIESFDMKINRVENSLCIRLDKVEDTLELIKSDIVDIRYELRGKAETVSQSA